MKHAIGYDWCQRGNCFGCTVIRS